MSPSLFVAFLWLPLVALGQTPSVAPTDTMSPTAVPWGGCVNPNEDADGDDKVTIGQTTYVCLNIANTSDWTSGVSYQRVSLNPKADQYSRLRVPGCKYQPLEFIVKYLVSRNSFGFVPYSQSTPTRWEPCSMVATFLSAQHPRQACHSCEHSTIVPRKKYTLFLQLLWM